MIPMEWLQDARNRLEGRVLQTPLIFDDQHDLFLKLENLQWTGSFKIRGALNRVLTLTDGERDGIITASAGNHGLGVAQAAAIEGGHAVVFISDHAVPEKVNAIRAAGGEIRAIQGGYGEAESAAIHYARENGGVYISPYNDGQVIAGQSTVGSELIAQMEDKKINSVIVPAGGGGLLAGIGLAFREAKIPVELIGVNPFESRFFFEQFNHASQAGVQDNPTLADGLSGGIDPQAITFPILKELHARVITVLEDQIQDAIRQAWFRYGQRLEGSAAIALAAFYHAAGIKPPVAVILTGGNIQPEVFSSLVAKDAARS